MLSVMHDDWHTKGGGGIKHGREHSSEGFAQSAAGQHKREGKVMSIAVSYWRLQACAAMCAKGGEASGASQQASRMHMLGKRIKLVKAVRRVGTRGLTRADSTGRSKGGGINQLQLGWEHKESTWGAGRRGAA